MNEIEKYKLKKVSDIQSDISELIKRNSLLIAECFHSRAYELRKEESQLEANRRNNAKLNMKENL